MNLKKITSIFYTFMKVLFKYLLSILRGVANMSTPTYDHYKCTPNLCQTTRFWSHTRMWDPGLLQSGPDQRNVDGKFMMDTLKPQKLATMDSLQLMADTVSQVLSQCITPSEMPIDNLDSMNICGESSFCYFFINMQPESQDCFKSQKEVFDQCTNDTNNNDDQSCYGSLYDGFEKMQRRISECSEDSFICFEDTSEPDINDSNDEDDLDDVKSNKCGCECAGKKVRFDLKPKIHVMRVWDFAYRAARKSDWQVYVRDRARFQQRIQRVSSILNPVLDCSHREQVFKERFL